MNKHTFYVSGTHCASCKIMIEDVLGENELVQSVSVDLKSKTLDLDTHSDKSKEELAEIFTQAISKHGYVVSATSLVLGKKDEKDIFGMALPLGLFFLTLFFWLQKSGVLNIGIEKATPVTGFIIGLVASVSSCLAVVGGLVLSISVKISEDNVSDTKTFVLFHLSRLVGFGFLGGVLGALGKAVGVNFTFNTILGLVASLVMIYLGLNLAGLLKENRLTFNSRIFDFFRRVENKNITPILVGFGTFFLPCGFTQSMQVVALSSGSFWSGALIMFAFALGTLPVLSLLSFGSASFADSKYAPLFFKTAGIVVLGLGMFAFISGLAGLGIIRPIFNI